jgi:hypothetical protein
MYFLCNLGMHTKDGFSSFYFLKLMFEFDMLISLMLVWHANVILWMIEEANNILGLGFYMMFGTSIVLLKLYLWTITLLSRFFYQSHALKVVAYFETLFFGLSHALKVLFLLIFFHYLFVVELKPLFFYLCFVHCEAR